jgi:hypothetical protein
MTLQRFLLPLLLCFATAPVVAEEVALTLANDGARTLRCQIIYAHWVTADLPVLGAGRSVAFTVQRDAATRELFVPREPDGRRMMLEGVLCGADADWGRTLTLLDLEAVTRGADLAFERRCAIETALSCSGWEPN